MTVKTIRQHVARVPVHIFRHVELIREPRRPGLCPICAACSTRLRSVCRHAAEMSYCPLLWRTIADYLGRNDYDLAHCFGAVSVYEFHPLFTELPNA